MEEQYIEYILKQYFNDINYSVKDGNSGMNNTTKFLVINEEEYVLRIYESHNDKKKVGFEHKILEELNRRNLSFAIPNPKVNFKGDTVALSIDGKLASLSKAIKGNNPYLKDKKQFYSLGKAVGEITRELSQVKIEIQSSYQPCYELEKSYPTCPLKDVIDFCDNPPEDFKSERGILGGLKKYFIEFKDIIPILRELPHQFIHGDINSSNVLEDEKRNICAILDFEFTARDLRCMDLAICLSEAIANDEDDKVKFDNITNFMTGYKKFISLTDDEIKVMPYLIMLRRLDVIIHFLVRYNEGINNSYITADKVLREQLIKGRHLCRWVEENTNRIREILK